MSDLQARSAYFSATDALKFLQRANWTYPESTHGVLKELVQE